MTEDEAKTKWCPFVRTPMKLGGGFPVANQVTIDGVADGPKCIGSECMAWRWTRPDWVPTPTPIPADGRMRWFDTAGNETAPPPNYVDGHCGLAGKP